MRNDVLHEPFELVVREFLDVCPRGQHAHSFFELVYVLAGTGKQMINQTEVPYQAGHLFLLAPNELHSFEIETATQFFFIRFNPIYITSDEGHKELIRRLGTILKNASHDPGNIIKKPSDQVIVSSIMDAIIGEHASYDLYHSELIRQLINALLVIVARNIALPGSATMDENSDTRAVDILQYIQSNIYKPDNLRIGHVSHLFGISETYLGHYFKRHSNESYQQYIMHYKFKLIEHRLLHSDMRINEIADEFGFTDKSHFSRMFKKYKGMNPSEFKRSAKAAIL
jgi:AraC-like DNA-binding protein